jgi:DNA polymerase-3 subunit gamma/tau
MLRAKDGCMTLFSSQAVVPEIAEPWHRGNQTWWRRSRMASQSLYRKWRSQTFADLVGQDAVVRTLRNAILSGRLAHAYLFCGPRGTGKTSTARLLAKTVNCQNPQDGEPCNTCQVCQEISAGISMDVIEIDAASNRGIDDIRDLREKVAVRPGIGRYKLYIIDEVHMLTTEAFNALLKTLEEPPPHVIFVLATTEVHKLPATVMSRCQRFDFKRIPARQIVQRLCYIAGQEQLDLDQHAAELIARAAAGGLRDALSLLDQANAYCGPSISLARVQAMLGVADPRAVHHLVCHIAALEAADGLRLINRLAESGADFRQLNAQLAEHWRAMMLAKTGVGIAPILDVTDEEGEEIASTATAFSLDELTAGARTFAANDLVGHSGSVPQLAIELAFLECLERHRLAAAADTHRESEPQLAHARPGTLVSAETRERSEPAASHESQESERAVASQPRRPEQQPAVVRETAPVVLHPSASLSSGNAVPASDHPAAGGAQVSLELINQRWQLIVNACKQKSYKVTALLRAAHPAEITGATGDELVLAVDHEFHLAKLREPANRVAVEWAVSQILERPWHVRFRLANSLERSEWLDGATVPALSPPAASVGEPFLAPAPKPSRGEIIALRHSADLAAPATVMSTADDQQRTPEPAIQVETEARDDRVVAQILRDYPASVRDVYPTQ